MFFIGGISTKEQVLDFTQTFICSNCRKYGRYEVYIRYTVFSLFFVPIIKFNKKFFVRTTCCGSLYLLKNKEKAINIERGHTENIVLSSDDLELIQNGICGMFCPNCGFQLDENYKYCPNCGRPVN